MKEMGEIEREGSLINEGRSGEADNSGSGLGGGGLKIRRGGGRKEGTEEGAIGEEEDESMEEGAGQKLGRGEG